MLTAAGGVRALPMKFDVVAVLQEHYLLPGPGTYSKQDVRSGCTCLGSSQRAFYASLQQIRPQKCVPCSRLPKQVLQHTDVHDGLLCCAWHLPCIASLPSLFYCLTLQVVESFGCQLVEGVLTHEQKRFVLDGNKCVLNRPGPDARVDDHDFLENEVYAVDIVVSTGEGKTRVSRSESSRVAHKPLGACPPCTYLCWEVSEGTARRHCRVHWRIVSTGLQQFKVSRR